MRIGAHRCAHSNRNVVFLLSQVSHFGVKRRKNWEKMQEKVARKTMSFDVVVCVFGRLYRCFVKIHQEKQANHWYIKPYMIGCDTCDSKNTKTPVMCVYTRTRESRWLHVFSQFNFSLPLLLLATTRKRHVVLEKTIRCFVENDTLFYGKRHVVLWKTSRRFTWNI